jgi:hypothetical protein
MPKEITKLAYSVCEAPDPLSGESRYRVVVKYSDGRIRSLAPRFKDERSLEIYLERWNPELQGKRVNFLQLAGR